MPNPKRKTAKQSEPGDSESVPAEEMETPVAGGPPVSADDPAPAPPCPCPSGDPVLSPEVVAWNARYDPEACERYRYAQRDFSEAAQNAIAEATARLMELEKGGDS